MDLLNPSPLARFKAVVSDDLVFVDPVSRTLLANLSRLAPTEVSVLIVGETGTGKEQVARHLHALSARRDGPFVAVNCGAVPKDLMEAEFFGHERGAFTGASGERVGWFETADGGTLFLDEIGDLPLSMQVKLLRALQEREVTRIGARRAIGIDIRLVTATNIDLPAAVKAGVFREDLYYRLDVASIQLQPLRKRQGDIAPLARHFLDRHGPRFGKAGYRLSDGALSALLAHDWPGNIRELENVIQRALIVASGPMISRDDLDFGRSRRPLADGSTNAKDLPDLLTTAFQNLLHADLPNPFDLAVDTLVTTAYEFCDRNQIQTAALLGISRNVLRTHLARLGHIRGRRPIGRISAHSGRDTIS